MPFSLFDATIPTYLQILPSVVGMIDLAQAHCQTSGLAEADLLGTRLAPDMWPLGEQLRETWNHSAGAIAGVRKGLFTPNRDIATDSFAGLKAQLGSAIADLKQVDRDDIDALVGKDAGFAFGTFRMDFTAENFLMSFSLPNFYFHATTTYAILRMQGVPVGKRNFLGTMRMKAPVAP